MDDPWGPPQNLGSTLNSSADDHCVFITPDERAMIFVSSRAGGLGNGDFYISFRHDKRDDFAWGPPQNIAAINSAFDEYGPWAFENENADALTFSSIRTVPEAQAGTTSTRAPSAKIGHSACPRASRN